MQGRLTEAAEVCEAAVEAARLAGNHHFLFWALFELAWPRYFAGDLAGAIEACEESLEYGDRLTGGTIPSAGGGPGWALGVALFTSGADRAGARGDACPGRRGDRVRGSGRALLRLGVARPRGAARPGTPRRPPRYAERAGPRWPTGSICISPPALPLAPGPAILLAAGECRGGRRAGPSRASSGRCRRGGRSASRLFAQPARAACSPSPGARRKRSPSFAKPSVASTPSARCASATPRGANCESSASAARLADRPAGETGLGSLTKREAEIADLVTDRKTNKEIAAELFLSEKTIESHLRNVFFKLGVSSRVDVARTIEREDRRNGRDRVSSEPGDARRRRGPAGGARLRPGAEARPADRRHGALGFAGISPVVGLYAVVLVGTAVAGAGVDLGAAGRARRPVPAARRLLRAGLGVSDRRRRLPVEPPAARRRATDGSTAGSRCARTRRPTRRSPTSARPGC